MWPFLLFIFKRLEIFQKISQTECEEEVLMKFSESLKKNKDFQIVYRKGRSFADRYLVMYIMPNDTDKNRVGISVSKKVGNSIVRHRLKRLIKESYRLSEANFRSGYDIIVIARTGAREKKYHEIESALIHLGKLHNIYVS